MSRSLLHDWEGSIEKNKNNTEELLKIAENIYNTAYTRGKASTERPHGDLISRSELKKAVNDFFDNHFKGLVSNELITYAKAVDNAIDNAPTFDIPNYDGQVVPDTLQGWRYEERPQGEWNYIQAGMCVCPFCGAMPHKLYKDYCAKCGAYLKGGAE